MKQIIIGTILLGGVWSLMRSSSHEFLKLINSETMIAIVYARFDNTMRIEHNSYAI